MDNKGFDSKNLAMMDEIGQMPLKFCMGGSKFRLDMLKMAFANQKTYPKPTVETLISDAEKLISWVNEDNLSTPIQQNTKPIKQ